MDFAYSVCIPTYNRAKDLASTLDSIIQQPEFGEDIEIVVVDNASVDQTEATVASLVDRYPDNIRYERNSSNIGPDANILKAALSGRGRYIKLLNDNKSLRAGVVQKWRDLFREADEGIVFHYPHARDPAKTVSELILDPDEFVRFASFNLTWLGGLSIKRELLHDLDLGGIDTTSRLAHVEVVFLLLRSGRKSRVYLADWFDEPNPPTRVGYNYFRVFNDTFPRMLDRAQSESCITRRTNRRLRSELLTGHTFPFILDSLTAKKASELEKGGAIPYLFKNFYSSPTLYFFPAWAAWTLLKQSCVQDNRVELA